jgi:hypothetical protein
MGDGRGEGLPRQVTYATCSGRRRGIHFVSRGRVPSKQLVVPGAGARDHEDVIDASFDLADAIITVRRLIREAWTHYR